MTRLALALASLAIAASLLAASQAAAEPQAHLNPVNLRVAGGSATWWPDNDFRLAWDLDRSAQDADPSTVHYLIRSATGAIASPVVSLPWEGNRVEHLHVPAIPGLYEAEVWLESRVGSGLAARVALRFDDVRPAPPGARAEGPWLSGGTAAKLNLEPPSTLSPSGIRGYAISVDRAPQGSPCAAAGRCTEAETDVRAPAAETVTLGFLPEGVSFAHVATVSGSGVRSAVRDVELHVDASPPAVTLAGTPGGWSDGPVPIAATASDALSGMERSGPAGPFTALSIDGGVPTISPGPSARAVVSGDGIHRVDSYARDAVGNLGAAGPAALSSTTVRIDTAPPRVAFAAAGDPRDPERIEATVSDSLAGPDAGRGSISFRRARSHGAFQPIPTAAAEGRLVARWDSETYPPGNYEFRATGYDAAGNAGSGDRRAGGARLVLSNPLKAEAALRFGFGGKRLVLHRCAGRSGARRCRREAIEPFERRPATRSAPYGRGIVVGGQLRSAAGSGLAGRQVELVETFGPGAEVPRRTTTVATGEDGAFVAHLSAGPGRSIEARFPGDRTLNHADGGVLQLRVPSAVRLRASAASAPVGGPPVVFSGRLAAAGATIPPSGRPLELQFRVAGSDWSEFRTVETDRHGRFRYSYAFSDDDSRGVRFQFRAFVPAQADWPYEPAPSRPISVTGR